MSSSLVSRVIVPAAALSTMPLPPMTSSAFVPEPMLIAPSVKTEVTKPLPPVEAVSAVPKMTPFWARSIVNVPRR